MPIARPAPQPGTSERVRSVLSTAPAALLASLLFAGAVGWVLRMRGHSFASLEHYVPIAVPFAAFFFDRLLPRPVRGARSAIDATVLGLALLRVLAPPLPFVSGHALFATYASLTAHRWPLRATALAVFVHVAYIKLFAGGGWLSFVGGVLAAGVAAWLRRRAPGGAPRA